MITLCQAQLTRLLKIAEEEGAEAALDKLRLEQAEQAADDYEGRIDALKALDEDGTGQDREDLYIPGCGQYDTVDSRGRPLKPLVNDAGEWLGM